MIWKETALPGLFIALDDKSFRFVIRCFLQRLAIRAPRRFGRPYPVQGQASDGGFTPVRFVKTNVLEDDSDSPHEVHTQRSLKTRRACARRARGGRLATPADAQGPDGRPHGPLLPGQAAAHQPARLRIIMIPPLPCVLTQNTPPCRPISACSSPAAARCHESARSGCPGPRPGRVFK